MDSGSQKSTAEELGLCPVSSETVAHTLFGGTQTKDESHSIPNRNKCFR